MIAMKWLKPLLRILLLLLLLLNIMGAFHAWKFTHFYDDAGHRNKRPEEMSSMEKLQMILTGVRLSKSVNREQPDVPFETVYLHTNNGLRLEGWWIPTPQPARGTVILLHGYGSRKDRHLSEAAWFREKGFHTFLLDFRAHGGSDGHACSIGYKEAEEVKLAYDYVSSKTALPLLLWGNSMGAAAILKAVPQYQLHPARIILESPFATLTDAVKARMRAVHLPGTPLAQLLTFWGSAELGIPGFRYQPAVYARSIQVPVLLNWGRHDNRVTIAETNTIFENLGTSRKTLHIFEDGGHGNFCDAQHAEWDKVMTRFLEQ